MKKITFSRQQILRTIHAACVALFFAACANQAGAAPAATDYTFSGTTVVATPNTNNTTSAYFADPASPGPAYTISIGSTSILGNTTVTVGAPPANKNEIDIYTGTINNDGTLSASHDVIKTHSDGTVVNEGSITSSNYVGIYIVGNGTVTNSGSVYGGFTTGSHSAIDIVGNGTLTNSGTVSGTYAGINIHSTGTVNNLAGGDIISTGSSAAVYIESAGTVTNSGSITDTGTGAGVYIDGAGTVTNKNNGSISGYYVGVDIQGAGTVTNTSGTISAGDTNDSSSGVYIENDGNVTNGGTIESLDSSVSNYGVYIGGNGTVTNTGSILGEYNTTGSDSNYGVYIGGNGTVTNTGSITAYYSYDGATGIYIGGAGMVTNTGSIYGGDSDGNAYGIDIAGDGTVINSRSIEARDTDGLGIGVYIGGNGNVTNSSSIYGGDSTGNAFGVDINGNGTVTSSGSIIAEDTSASAYGVYIGGAGTVINSGSIYGGDVTNSGFGVYINGGGAVYNTGIISVGGDNGGNAVYINGTGTVNNAGTINALPNLDHSIVINGNGTISNTASGYMESGLGVYVIGGGSLVNSGTIIATTGYGIDFGDSATVTLAGGTVVGQFNTAVEVNAFGGAASTVNVIGRANLTGQLISNTTLGTFNADLVGLTPAKLAQLAALNGNTAGTFLLGPNTYQWTNLTLVDNAISLEQHVDPGLVGAATAFDNATSTVGLPAAYDSVYLAAYSNPEAALNELVGREINQGLDTIGLNITTTLASDLNEHLDNILTGNQIGGFDVGGLHVSNAGSMYAMGDTTSQLESLMHMSSGMALRGTEMSTDTKAMVAAPPPPSWGVWASGNVTLGDESGQNTLSNFHSTLGSPTLGFDYRVTPNLVLGILGSYTTGDANFGDGSKIGSNVELAALYGTWRDGNWHVNGIAGGGWSQFNDHRTTFNGLTANSSPRGNDIITDFTGGYDFHLGDRWNVTPEVGLQYTHLDIDSFTESGAGLFDLSEGSQNIDSLRSHVGFKVDKAYSLGKDLTIIPEVRALWYHEFLDDSRGVATSLPGTPALGSFSVNTFSPQRDFALVGAGLNTAFTGYKGVPVGLFLNYNCQVGQDDYIANSVNAGIRVDF